jgi:type IV pilus assembly protein PilN
MTRINLLPWREEQRKERKQAFLVSLGGAAVAALATAFAFNLYFNSLIGAQQARNDRLNAEIATLDKQIARINDLEQQKQQFIARMEIIERLQGSRPEIVHVFDDLARIVPEGAQLTALTQTGARLKIEGLAQSSTRVSAFMRNIDESKWMRKPELEVIETKGKAPLGSNFVLFAEQVSVVAEEAAKEAGTKGGTRTAATGGSP